MAAETGDRTGFGGRRYASTLLETSSYRDAFDDYLGFLEPRLRELRRVLDPTGTLYLHLDYREAHAVKLLLDEVFGRECFLNELIWAYDYGGKPKSPLAAEARHDPRLRQGPRRATSSTPRRSSASPTWRPGSSRRRRPRAGRCRPASSGTRSSPPPGARRPATRRRSRRGSCGASCTPPRAPGDLVLDPFAGSGTLGAVAAATGRRYLLMDSSEDAVRVMRARLGA